MYKLFLEEARELLQKDADSKEWMTLWDKVTDHYGRYSKVLNMKVDTDKSIDVIGRICNQLEKEYK